MKTGHHHHDAELAGCAFSRAGSTLLLSFEWTDGATAKLLFSGITATRANDFGQQNVVSRLLISPVYSFAAEEIRTYVNWASSQRDYRAEMNDERATAILADVVGSRSTLFVLEPSAGAEVVVLCTSRRGH